MEPSAALPSHPSNTQHVTFQTPDKHMTSVPQTSKGTSPRQPSTTSADYFAQTPQHLKISSKQAINNKSSIPEGLNIKERIVTQHGRGGSVSENKLNKGDGTWAHKK